nr:MAG TPA: hypothetical protein [Caudoviricetes sp.]
MADLCSTVSAFRNDLDIHWDLGIFYILAE